MNWSKHLKDSFGYDEFITPQHKIVKDTTKNYDQLVVLPTGSGKSICYQLPAISSKGISIIISPLKSLIKDQVDNLKKKNIPVITFYGDTTKKEKQLLHEVIYETDHSVHLIYTTPETIEKNMTFREYLNILEDKGSLDRFVIDEAHCISQWGNNFRPAYKALKKIREIWTTVPIMALTATAPINVRNEIVRLLQFKQYKMYTKSYFRKNLNISIIEKSRILKNHNKNILTILNHVNFQEVSGIIYCQTRKKCETLEKYLNEGGLATKAYHAGLKKKLRNNIEEKWKANEIKVIIATIAFGMGIDKSDVRFVIHNDIPFSIESYYQEIGRAGRDGENSNCILFYSENDRANAKKLIKYSFRNSLKYQRTREQFLEHRTNMKNTIKMLEFFENFCINKKKCRHAAMSNYLGEPDLEPCMRCCDNCIKMNRCVTIKQIDISDICKDIVTIIFELNTSAYKSNIINTFKNKVCYKHQRRFKTKKNTMDIFKKCLVFLRVNNYIKEKIIKMEGSFGHLQMYQLFKKSRQILDGDNICLNLELNS